MCDKTVYLHIGMPKTGTTAIQKFCLDHSSALESLGVVYPQDDEFFWHWAHHPLAGVLSAPHSRAWIDSKYDVEPERIYGALVRWIDARAAQAFIISSEQFSMAENLYRVPQLLAGLKIRVICYFRWQDSLVQSWFKHGIVKDLHQLASDDVVRFIRHCESKLDYFQKAERLAGIFGKDNVIIRIFDRKCMKRGDVASDFLDAIGVDDAASRLFEKAEHVNTSLSGDFLELKAHMNQADLWEGDPEAIGRFSSEICNLLDEYSGDNTHSEMLEQCFSASLRQEILDRYAESNGKLADQYLDDPIHPPTVAAPPKNGNTDFDLSRIARLCVAIWKKKDLEVRRLQKEVDSLRERRCHRKRDHGITKVVPAA